MNSFLRSTTVILAALLLSCNSPKNHDTVQDLESYGQSEHILANGTTISKRFNLPEGFERTNEQANSFAIFLRELPLKPDGSKVLLFDGSIKSKEYFYDAVVDLPIGKKDLHQCADAVMRLRAEYLYQQGKYDKIHFNFTNGFRADYSEWMQGKRIVVSGNDVSWVEKTAPSNTKQDFWNYLEIIFSYAGTLSLDQELHSVKPDELQIGDVFIHGGSPGHAVIVVDLAVDSKSGTKLFLLAQSYMPAQEIQVLRNPNNTELSPWYELNPEGELHTAEWKFGWDELKRF